MFFIFRDFQLCYIYARFRVRDFVAKMFIQFPKHDILQESKFDVSCSEVVAKVKALQIKSSTVMHHETASGYVQKSALRYSSIDQHGLQSVSIVCQTKMSGC